MTRLELLKEQMKAWKYLQDSVTSEILFGGAAGGGKTWIGCLWLILSCNQFPGTRYALARARLTDLKQSSLLTFFDVCKQLGYRRDVHFSFNGQQNVIRWINGSEVYLKDLFQYPTDPEFESLGSTEYTYAFIDECSQVTSKARSILRSRLRYKHNEFNLIPKILYGSNPTKNFLYSDFYHPWKTNQLSEKKAYIPSFAKNNKHLSAHYIEVLKSLDEVSRKRLLEGDWEYDTDPGKLLEYEEILDLWNNTHVHPSNDKWITCDVARFGRDSTVIFIWHGLVVKHIYSYGKTSVEDTKRLILEQCDKHSIPMRNVIIDEDGVGGGVVDGLSTCVGFVNNSKALPGENSMVNYSNLKTQCYFELANQIKKSAIYIEEENVSFKEKLVQELEQIKRKDVDKENKIRLVDKETIKDNIGRSPDYSDAMMLRMYPLLRKSSAFLLSDPTGAVF